MAMLSSEAARCIMDDTDYNKSEDSSLNEQEEFAVSSFCHRGAGYHPGWFIGRYLYV